MFNGLGTTEMFLFGIVALMLFGSKLPEVARRFGGTYRDLRGKVDDFQKEFRDWDKIDSNSTSTPSSFTPDADDAPVKSEPTTPKFIPPSDDDE